MNRRRIRSFIVVPLVYIGVLILILGVQFYGDETFSEAFGDLTVKGKAQPGREDRLSGVSELDVAYRGLIFSFSAGIPLLIELEDRSHQTFMLQGYRPSETGFEVIFDKQIRIAYALTGEDFNRLAVSVLLPEVLMPAKLVELPVRFENPDGVVISKNFPTLQISHEGDNYFLTYPHPSDLDLNNGILYARPETASPINLTYGPGYENKETLFGSWYSGYRAKPAKETVESIIAEFIDRAYEGWKIERYDSESGTWTDEAGRRGFFEGLVNAYLSESIVRKEYIRALTEVRRAANLNPNALSETSNVFLGDLLDTTREARNRDKKEFERIQRLVRSSDASVFDYPYLLTYSANRGPDTLLPRVLEFLSVLDRNELNISSSLELYRSYIEEMYISKEVAEVLQPYESLAFEKILPSIVSSDLGIFIKSDTNMISIYDSILAGSLLKKSGEKENNGELASIGYDLIVSSLRLSDDQGFLPETLFLDNLTVIKKGGKIAPEKIYPLVTYNPNLPREISLYSVFEPGSWIRCAAEIEEIAVQGSERRVTFRFPEGRIHHFILHGVNPYKRLRLYDLNWRIDPRFEEYSIGAFYERDFKTLYVKYRHKEELEDLVIFY